VFGASRRSRDRKGSCPGFLDRHSDEAIKPGCRQERSSAMKIGAVFSQADSGTDPKLIRRFARTAEDAGFVI